MSKIIYQNSDGGVSIVTAKSGTATVALANRVVPSGTSYEIVADSVIPSDNTFRNAWRKSGSTINVDLAAAKEVALAEIKERALKAIKAANDATALGDTPTHTASAIQSAYSTAVSAVNADTTVANVKTEMVNFQSTYDS